MRSCERPRKRSASEPLPSSVSSRYSLSILTHGSSCRCRASSSLRRVCSFSFARSFLRAASQSFCVPVLCFVIVLSPSCDCLLSLGDLSDHVGSLSAAAARPRRICSRTLAEASSLPYSSCQFHHSYGVLRG